MVQSYLPAVANVASHEETWAPPGKYDWSCSSFGPAESTTQMANRLVQTDGSITFARWRQCALAHRQIDWFSHFGTPTGSVSILHNRPPLPPYNYPFPWGIWTPSNTIPWAHLSPQPKQNLDRFSCFWRVHYVTDWPTHRPCYLVR